MSGEPSAARAAGSAFDVHAPGPSTSEFEQGSSTPRDDNTVEDAAIFDTEEDLQQSIETAVDCAHEVVEVLREQMADPALRHQIYPHGTLAITTHADHNHGLGLDSSVMAAAATVHREFGGGGFDVAMFSGMARATLVCLPHDASVADELIGLRAASLLQRDVQWCELPMADLYGDSDDDYDIGPDGRSIARTAAAGAASASGAAAELRSGWRIRRVAEEVPRADEEVPRGADSAEENDDEEEGEEEEESEEEEDGEEEEEEEGEVGDNVGVAAAVSTHAHATGEASATQQAPHEPPPLPLASGAREPTGPAASAAARQRWASAPEIDELHTMREILGTREEVLACLALQDAWREARLRRGRSPLT